MSAATYDRQPSARFSVGAIHCSLFVAMHLRKKIWVNIKEETKTSWNKLFPKLEYSDFEQKPMCTKKVWIRPQIIIPNHLKKNPNSWYKLLFRLWWLLTWRLRHKLWRAASVSVMSGSRCCRSAGGRHWWILSSYFTLFYSSLFVFNLEIMLSIFLPFDLYS